MNVIRKATARDSELLAPLMRAFNEHEGIPWRPEAVGRAFGELCDEASLGFVLVSEAPQSGGAMSPEGYVVVTYNYDLEFAGRDAFVTELYVAAHARRRGLGAALMKTAEHEARSNGVVALHLLVAPGNRAAESLYRRAGFSASPRVMMTEGAPLAGR